MEKQFQQTAENSPSRKRTMTIVSKDAIRKLATVETDDSKYVPSDIPTAKFNELSQRKESVYVRHNLNENNTPGKPNVLLVATKE